MNNLIRGEFDKLTPFQQSKFQELTGWNVAQNKGWAMQSDAAYYKMIEWVKNMEEPAPIVATPEQEETCTDSPQK